MRKVLAAVGIVMLSAIVANASTITGRLVATVDASDATLWHVAVQVQSSQTTNQGAGGAGDGGVAGVQFDVISDGNNVGSAPVPAGAGPLASKAKTSFISGFTTVTPAKRDAVPADNPGNSKYNGDGDLDAVFGSIFDTGGFANTAAGASGFSTIATEDWTIPLNKQDHLSLVLVSPQYYDFTNGQSPSFQVAYSNAPAIDVSSSGGQSNGVNGTIGVVPEPTSIVLMGLGGLGLIGFVRRRRA